jgi:general secretion pathway protein A
MYLTGSTLDSIEKIRFMVEERQGLAMILGDVGLGKSTVLRLLESEYADEEKYTTTLLTRADFTSPFAFAKKVSADFGIGPCRSLQSQHDELEKFLVQRYKSEKNVILFIDEGQQLSAELLEVIRALLNFETYYEKLIQIVIAGQLDLLDRVRAKRNKALRSRIFAPCVLKPLDVHETSSMIDFRCERSGVANPFTADAVQRIYEASEGVPRSILLLCAHAIRKARAPIRAADIGLAIEQAQVAVP